MSPSIGMTAVPSPAPAAAAACTPPCTWVLVTVHGARCAGPGAPPGGHDLTDPANAFPLPGGGIACIPCMAAGDAAYAARRAQRAAARAHTAAPGACTPARPRARTARLTLVQ